MRADALRQRLAEAGQLVSWPDGAPAEFHALTADSRKVGTGCLFIAYAGTTSDGHAYAPVAAQAGAACVMAEHPVGGLTVPQILVASGRHAAALAAALFYGDPAAALDLLAVTGTNGKTTTTALIAHPVFLMDLQKSTRWENHRPWSTLEQKEKMRREEQRYFLYRQPAMRVDVHVG